MTTESGVQVNLADLRRVAQLDPATSQALARHYEQWRLLRSGRVLTVEDLGEASMPVSTLINALARFEESAARLSFLPPELRDKEIADAAQATSLSTEDYLLVQEWWIHGGSEVVRAES